MTYKGVGVLTFASPKIEEWLTHLNDLCIKYDVNPRMALRRRHIKKMFLETCQKYFEFADDWKEVLEEKIKKIGKEKNK